MNVHTQYLSKMPIEIWDLGNTSSVLYTYLYLFGIQLQIYLFKAVILPPYRDVGDGWDRCRAGGKDHYQVK